METITTIDTKTPPDVTESSVKKTDMLPRSERKITLVLKSGREAVCSIMPTLMWIKQKYKELLRRQQVIGSKLEGLEERRSALHRQLAEATSKNDPGASDIESTLEKLYGEVATLEATSRTINYDLAAYAVHLPSIDGKAISKEDVDWEHCDETQITEAQRFFLLR